MYRSIIDILGIAAALGILALGILLFAIPLMGTQDVGTYGYEQSIYSGQHAATEGAE